MSHDKSSDQMKKKLTEAEAAFKAWWLDNANQYQNRQSVAWAIWKQAWHFSRDSFQSATSPSDEPGKVPPESFTDAVAGWLSRWPADHLTWRMGDLYDRIVTAEFVRSIAPSATTNTPHAIGPGCRAFSRTIKLSAASWACDTCGASNIAPKCQYVGEK